MPTDKFGHPFLYPTKKTAGLSGSGTGFFYQQSDNVLNDAFFEDINAEVDVGSNGVFTINFGQSDSVVVFKHREFADDESIGGNDMDFEETEDRGYGYKKDDPRDIELKMVIKVTSAASGKGFSLKGPSGHHDSPEPGCQGNGYMFSMEDLTDSPQHFRFRKEMWHVNYDDHPTTKTWTHPKVNFAMLGAGWRGIAFVRYNRPNGVSSGKDSVVVEGWFNPTPDSNKNNWIMLKRVEDKGGWGDGGDECGGDEDQILTWSNGMFIIKGSDLEIDFKHLSLREIAPFEEFDDDPTNNPGGGTGGGGAPTVPTEVIGGLTLRNSINNYITSPCSGSGLSTFYSSTEDGNVWTFNKDGGDGRNKTRIGIWCKSSSSGIFGSSPKQVDFYLKKTGSPTGTLTVRIRGGSGGNTIKATMGTLDVSTLTTSLVLNNFINLSNTYNITTGDSISADYSDGDQNNYVSMGRRNTLDATTGVHTQAFYHDFNTFTYYFHTDKEIPGRLWH